MKRTYNKKAVKRKLKRTYNKKEEKPIVVKEEILKEVKKKKDKD